MANTFDAFISRTGAEALVPAPISGEIFSDIAQQSAVLRMARRLPNMTSKMLKLPVLNSLPSAYFVSGDNGLKQTTSVDQRGMDRKKYCGRGDCGDCAGARRGASGQRI